MDQQPDVNDLFPEQAKSVDDLFPADVENDRYRRQTLGTSPIQDLIFGDTRVNPIARVLHAFGQGAAQTWGAQDATRISKESEDFLKANKQFDDWNKGQNSLVKAANDSLFRPAAAQLVKEVHDAEALFRGFGAAIHGTQAAISQTGEELSGGTIDTGMKAATGLMGQSVGTAQLGHDIAGAIEALPTGLRAPTGIPHGAPHPALTEAKKLEAEIERARSLGVIGAGEAGYMGTKPIEVAPPISGPDAAPTRAGMPVDLFGERPTSKPLEAVPEPSVTAPEAPSPTEGAAPNPIAEDVAAKLVAIGRPEAEARASGALIASHYEARAERFNGERGTAEDLYRADGPDIRGADGKAPARSEPIKPIEGDGAAVDSGPKPELDGGAAEPITTVPELKKALRGRAAADPQTWSLYEFLAKEGGLKPTDDLKSIFGGKNPFVPGFGPLLRKGGLTMDEALTRAKENSYILDPNDLQHVGSDATRASGELTVSVNHLHDMLNNESRGQKNYRTDHVRPEGKIDLEEERGHIISDLHKQVQEATDRPQRIDPAIEDRVVQIVQKEGGDVHSAYERAIMEAHDAEDALLDGRRSDARTADIAGHDAPDSGAASHSGQEFIDDSGYTWSSEQEARQANEFASRDHGENDRASREELEYFQRQRLPMDTESRLARAKELGFDTSKPWYHGTARSDRLTEKGKLEPKRATSGPMPFFTDDPELGSSYATKKPDTSLEVPDDYSGWFKYKPKGGRSTVDLDRSWDHLDQETKKTISERAPHINVDENGHITYNKDQGFPAGSLKDWNEYYLPREGQGNPLKTLKEVWLNSGMLFGDEAKFMEVLQHAGMKDIEFDHPHRTEPGVLKVYMKIRNPLDTSNVEALKALLPDAEALASRSRRQSKPGADMWDKSSTTPRMWLDRLKEDIENGTTHAWTSIPDEVTRLLQSKGYDAILDKGGKGEGPGHSVMIPFRPDQVRSVNAKFDTANPDGTELLDQIKRGSIKLRNDAKPIITLFKDANASTFIHETGHQWLEELMKDSEHPKAPAELKADAIKVLDWLGVDNADKIKTSHHEKFARGFERYMMEGKAPNQALANVFEHFKAWLTKIYQTVTRLKSPINDEIRGVFDRLLTMHPSEVKLDGPPKTFADIHETDAIHTSPEVARPVAETIRAERDMLANEHIPEEHDARLEGIAAGASRREAGGPQPVRDGNETPRPQETGNDQASGTVGEGGSNASPEGARPSVGGGKTEAPVSPHSTFTGPESPFVDKAGNIRLDNLGTAEDVNKAIRDAAEASNDFIDARRGVITDGQVLELADALGMDESKLNQRKLGQAFNAEEVMAARKLLIQSATDVRDAMVKAAAGAEPDILAYVEAKQRFQMIANNVAGITAEAGRALRAFRKLPGQDEAGQLAAFLKDETGKTLFQLQREAELGAKLSSPAEVAKFVNLSSKPTWSQKLMEAWITALLSGPKTHVANIMGNTISSIARPVETAMAATIGKARSIVTGSQDRVMFGEASAELFGLVQGAREGVIAGYQAFKTEEPQTTSTRQVEKGHPKAMGSWDVNVFGRDMEVGGKQLRIPLRLLGAEDEFFKAITSRGTINREAYAQAAKENLSPEMFNQRVAELSMNPTEAMLEKAKEVADYQTFQTPLGTTGRAVQNFANSHMLAKFIVPFVRTPLNLLKYAFERTPLGVFAEEARANLSGKNGNVARDTQIARMALGTMVGIATYELASQGLITGGGPGDKKQKVALQENGWQEYSVRIGDMYYSYNRLDPFSIILGLVADAHEINQAGHSAHADKEHIPAMVFASITQQIMNRASLRGPSDLLKAVTDPERFGNGYIKGMAGTVVPAILAQTAQTIDPVMRETRSVLDGIKARIPGMSQDLMPRRTVWGEVKTREGGLGPDIASPIPESQIKNDPVNQALFDLKAFPSKLDRKIRGVELTDQQYDDYQRVAGRMAKVRLNAIVGMPGFTQMPEATRKELMTNTINTSRETARSLIMMQNPDIIKKASDAKTARLTAH